MMRTVRDDEDKGEEEDDTPANPSEMLEFEFFHLESGRTFRYVVRRQELSKASRAVSPDRQERRVRGTPVPPELILREADEKKAWSNATDNRTRRAIADGYPDDGEVYQNFADFGGCSATVLSATDTEMIALTAAHCIFSESGVVSSSLLYPRLNRGIVSPTWSTWYPRYFGYYPSYLDKNCDDAFDDKCRKYDIALVGAEPGPNAIPPNGLGWAYRRESFLDDHAKYRRGYPGCGSSGAPSPCDRDGTLYGDGALTVGSFKAKQGGWHRRCRFSSDVSPGDSGSALYYYNHGQPYVFAVASSQDDCKWDCSRDRPNHARLHDEVWFDFINSVVP